MLLDRTDLYVRMYPETIAEIERGDMNFISTAIGAAEKQCKSYLSRYNLPKLFNTGTPGFVADENLKNILIDMTCWHLVSLANVNVDLSLFEKRFDDAIAWLKMVQSGKCDPEGWPYKDDDEDSSFTEGQETSFYSNTKRSNHY